MNDVREQRSVLSQIRRRLAGPDAELQEPLLSLVALGWGLVLALWPADSLDASPAFIAIARVAPDHLWASILILGGSLGLCGYAMEIRNLRRVCAAVGTFMWVLMAYLLWVQPSPGLGLSFLPVAALASALTLMRLEMSA